MKAPFGAETPDEVLIAYVDGGLTPAERIEVERWLDEHPEWRSRLGSYTAIGRAVREGGADRADAPDISALDGLWAAIDAEPASPPATLPPPSPAPAPTSPSSSPPPPPPSTSSPTGGNVVSLDSRRRQPRWLMAAAAAAVLVVGGAVVVTRGGGDAGNDSAVEEPSDAPEPPSRAPDGAPDDGDSAGETPGDADEPGRGPEDGSDNESDGESDSGSADVDEMPPPNQALPDPVPDGGPLDDVIQRERMAEVVQAVADTMAVGSAQVIVDSVTTLDMAGTQWETGDDLANVYGSGAGGVDFASGLVLDAELENPDEMLWPATGTRSQVLQHVDGELFVRCAGDDAMEAMPGDESGCAFGTGVSPIGLFAVLDVLSAGDGEVTRAGPDPDGLMGYLVETEVTVAGTAQRLPVQVQVYVDPDDGLIDFLRAYTDDGDVAQITVGGAEGEPATVEAELLWVNFELTEHGAPVELPTVD